MFLVKILSKFEKFWGFKVKFCHFSQKRDFLKITKNAKAFTKNMLEGWNLAQRYLSIVSTTSRSQFFEFLIFFQIMAIFVQNFAFCPKFWTKMAIIWKKIKNSKNWLLEVVETIERYLWANFQPSSVFLVKALHGVSHP